MNKFVGGKMFLVKFGPGSHDPVWPVDIFQPQIKEASAVIGSLLADAINGFPCKRRTKMQLSQPIGPPTPGGGSHKSSSRVAVSDACRVTRAIRRRLRDPSGSAITSGAGTHARTQDRPAAALPTGSPLEQKCASVKTLQPIHAFRLGGLRCCVSR